MRGGQFRNATNVNIELQSFRAIRLKRPGASCALGKESFRFGRRLRLMLPSFPTGIGLNQAISPCQSSALSYRRSCATYVVSSLYYPVCSAQSCHSNPYATFKLDSNFRFATKCLLKSSCPNFTCPTPTWTLKMHRDKPKSLSPPLLLLHSVYHPRCIQLSCRLEDSASRSLTTISHVNVCGSSLPSCPS